MLGKISLGATYREVVQASTLAALSGASVFDQFRERVAAAATAGSSANSDSADFRLDATHPPTPWRIAFVRSSRVAAKLTVSAAESGAIDAELRTFEEALSKETTERYRASLYR